MNVSFPSCRPVRSAGLRLLQAADGARPVRIPAFAPCRMAKGFERCAPVPEAPWGARGVALVITLILLSVITVLAVAFLALAMHDRRAAGSTDKMTTAQLMADAARDRAIAEIGAQMMEGYLHGATSLMDFDMLVSEADPAQSDPYRLVAPATNIRSGAVEADTNLTFLDLNRNGFFDSSASTNGSGDPEWIGVPELSGLPRDKNPLIGRYAYLVQPAGKSLDINFGYNQAKLAAQPAPMAPPDPRGVSEAYWRSSGVGSWELNLAAFLVDLNTNAWEPMANVYFPNLAVHSEGPAYRDAWELLKHRYQSNLFTLEPAPPPLVDLGEFTNHWAGSESPRRFYDPAELFDARRPYTNLVATLTNIQSEPPNLDPTNDYNRQTFYRLLSQMGMDSVPDTPRINLNYINLRPDPYLDPASGRILTNWTPTNLLETGIYEPWTLTNGHLFFNQVAARLLADLKATERAHGWSTHAGIEVYSNGTYRIPVYPLTNSCYTPAVHRLLQLTANLFDTVCDHSGDNLRSGLTNSLYYPTVFRPVLEVTHRTNIAVVNYVPDNGSSLISAYLTTNNWHDPHDPAFDPDRVRSNHFLFGVPLILGAKKGYPNFNEFTLDTGMLVQRKAELVKSDPLLAPSQTNQMYSLSLTNRFGVELWNSYTQAFPYPLRVAVNSIMNTALYAVTNNGAGATNALPVPLPSASVFIYTNITTSWLGKQYISMLITNTAQFPGLVALPLSQYRFASRTFGPTSPPETTGLPVPEWSVAVSNRLWVMIYDPGTFRVLDAVALAGLGHQTNILSALTQAPEDFSRFWDTNLVNPMLTKGLLEQINISIGQTYIPLSEWRSYGGVNDKDGSIINASNFLAGIVTTPGGANPVLSLGFTPTVRLYLTTSWQANDPLVHSMPWDLLEHTNSVELTYRKPKEPSLWPNDSNLGKVNPRYRPWYYGIADYGSDPIPFDLTVQDPMVRSSDDWDFPEHKLPTVGWLGRVHRGTPWQTVYFKAEPAVMDTNNLDNNAWFNRLRVAYMPQSHPTNDWRLVDLFTTAPNANATRGTLSINQTNQAAWSAVLGGVLVATNSSLPADRPLEPSPKIPLPWLSAIPDFLGTTNVLPASPELTQIVQGIERHRARRAALAGNHHARVFNRLSEVLAVPELTVNRQVRYPDGKPVRSPFLFMRSPSPLDDEEQRVRLTDAAYEWLPTQILSLLRVGEPRVVVYAYGQSLEPYGPEHVTSDGPNNYRVTAEHATRTVVRYELEPVPSGTNLTYALRPVIESFNVLNPD